jgi:hypothetical protein
MALPTNLGKKSNFRYRGKKPDFSAVKTGFPSESRKLLLTFKNHGF